MAADTKGYFNDKAVSWRILPEHQKRSAAVAEYMREKVRLDPNRTEALDFGCGTGHLAFLLRKNVRHITAVDAAEGMIAQLEQTVRETGTANVEARVLDIEHELRLLPREGYDLIYSQMVLHHIEDYKRVLGELRLLLKPSGALCLIDLEQEDGSFHDGSVFVPHRGFVREELGRELERQGFFDAEFCRPYTIKKQDASGTERTYPLFMALAYKMPRAGS